MTDEEEKEVNLAGRATFLRQAEESLLPYVRQLDTFAGVWQDQQHDGRLVVMLTSVDDAVVKAIRAREPKDSRGIRIEQATYSYAQLRRAMETLTSDWDRLMRGAEFVGVGLSERNNALDIDVVSEDMDKVESAMRSTKDELAVPLILREGDSGRDAGCNPRGDCYPLRGGAKIYKGSLPSNLNCTSCYFCTVGFLVYTQSDAVENSPRTQLLTAGHCGYASPTNWFNKGMEQYNCTQCEDGKVGIKKQTLYDASGSNRIDIMRVGVNDSEAMSTIIAKESGGHVSGPSTIIEGSVLCVSTGHSVAKFCGEVKNASRSWLSETASPDRVVYGAAMDSGPDHGNRDNPTLIGGDSGSPVYDRYYIGGTSNLILGAMGIADHERYKAGAPSQYGSHDVYFAVVKDSLPRLDADIYMP